MLMFIRADAVCINQVDSTEKNWQVAQMGKIYEHAQTTFLYLGPASEHSSLAIDMLVEISQMYSNDEDAARIIDDVLAKQGSEPTNEASDCEKLVRRLLRHLEVENVNKLLEELTGSGRSSWHRVW